MAVRLASHAQRLNALPLSAFKHLFASLPAATGILSGVFDGTLTGPGWSRLISLPSMALGGLGGWIGKQVSTSGEGYNRVLRNGMEKLVIPFYVSIQASQLDGAPAFRVTYRRENRFPWPLVIDELRWIDEATLLGMTMLHGLSWPRLALPFLLQVKE